VSHEVIEVTVDTVASAVQPVIEAYPNKVLKGATLELHAIHDLSEDF